MGQIHKIGEEYYIEFTARGLLYQQKAGTDLSKAEELLRSTEDKIAKGELQAVVRDIDLDVFCLEFLKYAKTQNHPSTIRRLSAAIDHFGGYVRKHHPDAKKLSQITPRVIEDYKTFGIEQRKALMDALNPKVVNLTLLLLREMFEYGIKTGFINDNPTLHVRLLDVGRSVAFSLTDAQLAILSNNIERPYQDFIILMRYTGLRTNEVIDLTWQQVDLNRNVIFVKLREIPLMPQALAVLKERFIGVIDHKARVFSDPGGNRIKLSELVRLFNQACVLAGLLSVSLISLRHTFAGDLFKRRVSLLSIGRILGVYDVAKLMVFSLYIPVSREDIAR